jgi:transcriptional regulator with XRE-family HTH domain
MKQVKGPEMLRQWRKETGLSQEKLADMLGTIQQTVQHWECKRRTPGLRMALKLEDVTGIPAGVWVVLN